MTLAEKLDCLSKEHGKISVEQETEVLWMEIESLFLEIYFSPNVNRMKIWLYGSWEENNITYRIDGDDKSVRRPFKRRYSPNRLTEISRHANQNRLGFKISTPGNQYKDPLLELWHPADDKEFKTN